MADYFRNQSVTVGTTQTQIAAQVLPEQRRFISVINTSTGGQAVTLAIGADAVAGAGIVLSPGGSYSDSADGTAYFPPHFYIQAVSDVAGATLAIVERINTG